MDEPQQGEAGGAEYDILVAEFGAGHNTLHIHVTSLEIRVFIPLSCTLLYLVRCMRRFTNQPRPAQCPHNTRAGPSASRSISTALAFPYRADTQRIYYPHSEPLSKSCLTPCHRSTKLPRSRQSALQAYGQAKGGWNEHSSLAH